MTQHFLRLWRRQRAADPVNLSIWNKKTVISVFVGFENNLSKRYFPVATIFSQKRLQKISFYLQGCIYASGGMCFRCPLVKKVSEVNRPLESEYKTVVVYEQPAFAEEKIHQKRLFICRDMFCWQERPETVLRIPKQLSPEQHPLQQSFPGKKFHHLPVSIVPVLIFLIFFRLFVFFCQWSITKHQRSDKQISSSSSSNK